MYFNVFKIISTLNNKEEKILFIDSFIFSNHLTVAKVIANKIGKASWSTMQNIWSPFIYLGLQIL